jgi:hypothetical protein
LLGSRIEKFSSERTVGYLTGHTKISSYEKWDILKISHARDAQGSDDINVVSWTVVRG